MSDFSATSAPPIIRSADPAGDAAACAAIYAPAVAGLASFEEAAPDAAQMRRRIETVQQTHPWLVADVGGRAVGYAYAIAHSPRAAYRWTVDVSIFIAPVHQGRGVGRALYETLFDLLRRQGLYEVCAGISLPNPASVALHERLGFTLVGIYRNVGFKQGAWRDVGWWQRSLQPRPAGDPREPTLPKRPG